MQRRFDLAIVVIAVMVLIFAGVAGIAEDCRTARQLLVGDSSATILGYFFS